jgi:hypothetical protein
LQHHPPGWLLDGKDEIAMLNDYPHIVLCGHIHEATLQEIVTYGGTRNLQMIAGAVHGKDSRKYTFRIGRLNADGFTYWSRLWLESVKRFNFDNILNLTPEFCINIPLKELSPNLQFWIQQNFKATDFKMKGNTDDEKRKVKERVGEYDQFKTNEEKKLKARFIVGGDPSVIEGLGTCYQDERPCGLPMEFICLIAESIRNAEAAQETRDFIYHCRGISQVVDKLNTLIMSGKYDEAATLIDYQLRNQTHFLIRFIANLKRTYSKDDLWAPEERLKEFVRRRIKDHVSFSTNDFLEGLMAAIFFYHLKSSRKSIADYLRDNSEIRIQLGNFPGLFETLEKMFHRLFSERIEMTKNAFFKSLAGVERKEIMSCLQSVYNVLPHIKGQLPTIWSPEN